MPCEIDFTEGQTFEIVPLEQANGGTIILAVIILAVFISFSGDLLVDVFYRLAHG